MCRELSPLAEAEIDQLESEGIRLTARDVVRINAIAHRIETPGSAIALSRGIPVSVGGVYLWPMTLAASDWFRRVGGRIGGVREQTTALAYAMAHGREPLPEDDDTAKRCVREWARGLRCRHAEIVEAIKQIVEQDDADEIEDTGKTTSPGEISCMLSAMTGITPDVWEYQCSIQYVLTMLDAIVAQNTADGKSTKHDPRIKAERAMGLVVKRIRDRNRKAG